MSPKLLALAGVAASVSAANMAARACCPGQALFLLVLAWVAMFVGRAST